MEAALILHRISWIEIWCSILQSSVVDGTDGYTPVEIPQVGQKLTANVTVDEGTVGSYPVDENISYVWSYEDSDTVLSERSPSLS